MSDFEFIFSGITIVLALAVARLLEGLRDVFDRRRRFWIHYLWVVNRLLYTLAIFWAGFSARDRTGHTFLSFLALITPPAVVFIQANALITPQPSSVVDWKNHFWSIRRWFFAANMFLAVGVFAGITLSAGADASGYRYGPVAAGLLLSIVGFRSSSERVHGVLAVFATLSLATGFGLILVR